MKYNEIINKSNFDVSTVIFDGTMMEMPTNEEIKDIVKTAKGKVYKHKKGTNINYPINIDSTLYDITYIDKNDVMWSEIDLNIVELTIRLNDLKNKIEKNYLNIFKSSNRTVLN
ncbi:hypothetical protein UT300003_32210 [Clostridium sardiniense]